jgi:glycosyltransferase involved in cell wall biosynthesis
MDSGLVSIIVPTYDRAELLRSTLDSLMAQTYSNFEVIVVDDGSPNDKTKVICESYPKIKYLRINNSGGPARPRNEGIRYASGAYIAFTDDDDLWVPHKLETQISILQSDPETGLVHNCCQLISKEGELLDEIIGRPGQPEEKSGRVFMRMIGNWTLMTSSVLLRRSLADKVGYFNESMPSAGEDLEYWARCSFQGRFKYIDEPLVYYRVHAGASESNRKKYQELPKYLLHVIKNAKDSGFINSREFDKLRGQLVRMQIKKGKLGWITTFGKLFYLNPFWFLNFNNIKLLAVVISKRS